MTHLIYKAHLIYKGFTDLPIKIVIFPGYVELPEGTSTFW